MISKREKKILLFFLRDKNKKNWFQIIKEFTTLSISKKELPTYYISNLLYRKNVSTASMVLVKRKGSNCISRKQIII